MKLTYFVALIILVLLKKNIELLVLPDISQPSQKADFLNLQILKVVAWADFHFAEHHSGFP